MRFVARSLGKIQPRGSDAHPTAYCEDTAAFAHTVQPSQSSAPGRLRPVRRRSLQLSAVGLTHPGRRRKGNDRSVYRRRDPALRDTDTDLPQASQHSNTVDDQRQVPCPSFPARRRIGEDGENPSDEHEEDPSPLTKPLKHDFAATRDTERFAKCRGHGAPCRHGKARERSRKVDRSEYINEARRRHPRFRDRF
jgi:hypothetical protein